MTADSRPGYHRRSIIWIGLAILALLLDRIIPDSVWEVLYYRGVYQVIRPVYGLLWGWSPVPMVYVLVAFILFRMVIWWRNRTGGWKYMVSQAFGGIAALVFFFYLLWAFNYHQQPLKQRLGVNESNIGEHEIRREFLQASEDLRQSASVLDTSLLRNEAIADAPVIDRDLRTYVQGALTALQLPNNGVVRVRQLWPRGSLLHWSTAGIYIPQTGEGHIDAGLLSIQKPYTMAHEMAHGYGVTDEGECNFIAWLACQRAIDPWIRYSGAFSYWRYAAAEMPRDTVDVMLASLPEVVNRTLLLIRANDRKYKDWFPRMRDAIYSNYLKSHGVTKGLRSYNEVVLLVQQYRDSVSVAD